MSTVVMTAAKLITNTLTIFAIIHKQFCVAIKVMDTSQIKEEYVVRNLEREARIMSNISHPCVAALYETMQCGTVYYLVTELASGGDMCNHIKAQKSGKLDEQVARGYARQIISAISHMHARGIVHRDLKMENIMVASNRNQIKIVDFGLSNIWTAQSPLRTHCGSPEYAAPELFLIGRQYGPEVDLWSLGVILYGMVTGRLPFVSSRDEVASSQERRQRLLSQINRGLTTVHRKELTSLSPDFKNLVAKLLVPCAQSRITTDNLIYHPWVTQHQRKMLKINPMGKVDSYWQTMVLKEISSLLNTDPYTVNFEINANRFGAIGGMYNIREHQQLLHDLDSDAITYERALTPILHIPGPFKANLRGMRPQVEKCRPNRAAAGGKAKAGAAAQRHADGGRPSAAQVAHSAGDSEPSTAKHLREPGKSALPCRPRLYQSAGDGCPTVTTQPPPAVVISHRSSDTVANESIDQQSTPYSSSGGGVNRCPLHSSQPRKRHTSQRALPEMAIPDSSASKLHVVGSRGLPRPFGQRPATVHVNVKAPPPKVPTEYDMQKQRLVCYKSRIKSDPLSTQTPHRPYITSVQKHSGDVSNSSAATSALRKCNRTPLHTRHGEKSSTSNGSSKDHNLRKYNSVNYANHVKFSSNPVEKSSDHSEVQCFQKRENPIAKSIAGYVKTFNHDARSNKAERVPVKTNHGLQKW